MPTPKRKIKTTPKTAAQAKADKYISAKGETSAKPGEQSAEYYLEGQVYDAPPKPRVGRPPMKFDPMVAKVLLEEISQGEQSIRAILESRPGFYPSRATLWKWMAENPDFADQYKIAKAEQTHSFVDDTIYLTDNAKAETASVVSLQVRARQWQAERLQPKVYGNVQHIEQTVTQASPMAGLFEQMTQEERDQLRTLLTTVANRANAADATQRTQAPRQIEAKARRAK
jgi:hypothetical protein